MGKVHLTRFCKILPTLPSQVLFEAFTVLITLFIYIYLQCRPCIYIVIFNQEITQVIKVMVRKKLIEFRDIDLYLEVERFSNENNRGVFTKGLMELISKGLELEAMEKAKSDAVTGITYNTTSWGIAE